MDDDTIRVIVMSGVPGAGKTTAAEALADALHARHIPHALIDLDYLCQCYPDDGDANADLMFQNLASVWPNYARRGIRTLVAARVVDHASHADKYRRAIPGCELTVVCVTAPVDEVDRRIEARETGDWVERMKRLSLTLRPAIETGGFEDYRVVNVNKTPAELGPEILALLQAAGRFPSVD